MKDNTDSLVSGFLVNSFENVSPKFTELTVLYQSKVNVIARGKRYGRRWLIKGLTAECRNKEVFKQWLHKEFDLMVELQNPYVVSTIGWEDVSDWGECIIMEYVEGVSLSKWLERDPSIELRRKVAWELTEAVGYIHLKNVFHRDLKPENIIITSNGSNVKLIDFGLADGDGDGYTIFKQSSGTDKFMSPEQKVDDHPDVRNDIYSIGVIFDMLNLGWGYKQIIKKAVTNQTDRYQNVSELQNAINQIHKRRLNLYLSIGIIIFILLSIVIAFQYNRVVSLTQNEEIRRQEQDHLKHKISDLTDSLSVRTAKSQVEMSELNKHLEVMRVANDELKRDNNQMLSHKELVNNVIQEGKSRIALERKRLGVQNL